MSGFGRTGKWFAIEHWDVSPHPTAAELNGHHVECQLCQQSKLVPELKQ
jgi:hypothetical protein